VSVCVCVCVCVCACECVVHAFASESQRCYGDGIEVGGSLACGVHAAHSHCIEANAHMVVSESSTADTCVHVACCIAGIGSCVVAVQCSAVWCSAVWCSAAMSCKAVSVQTHAHTLKLAHMQRGCGGCDHL
jgi:hypothetical protein